MPVGAIFSNFSLTDDVQQEINLQHVIHNLEFTKIAQAVESTQR